MPSKSDGRPQRDGGDDGCRLPTVTEIYFAHSGLNGGPWQQLNQHLLHVAEVAARLAREAGATEAQVRRAWVLGLIHDFGKYRSEFQKLLRGEVKNAPHSVYGAALAAHNGRAPDLAFAVMGHHAGMPDPEDLKGAITKVRSEVDPLFCVAQRDCPEFSQSLPLAPLAPDYLTAECATRVLFSCLIDADRIDTARHFGEEYPAPAPLDARGRLARLLEYVAERARRVADGPVKAARGEVLQACLKGAVRKGPLFSLTVPTGGGKTLASMAFALTRAEMFASDVRRIIVVIPYLSIIEQNAKVYRESLGDDAVLEHHSGVWARDAEQAYVHPSMRLAIENWDAPIVVTTSVRFFESLFSNRPADLRRVHNIARSVVILDEVQTLPRERVGPILSMMKQLAEQWHTTFLFCTATQPAFERKTDNRDDPRWAPGSLDEVMPEPGKLFARLRRVQVKWPREGEVKSWADVAREVEHEPQALVVVNTRKHALALFRELRPAGPHVVHLSNNMCPAHRLERLACIRERLDRGERCIVVSTQLVEAGVDLDFPAVWRAMGPFDSIAQAAGRCDREGKLTAELGRPGGRVVVFQPDEPQMPPGVYAEAAAFTRVMAAAGCLSIDDPETVRTYFDRLYAGGLDPGNIEALRRKMMFRSVAEKFAIIDDATRSVVVPYREDARESLRAVQFGSIAALRKLQPYVVNLWEPDLQKGQALGSIYRVREGIDVWACPEGFYDHETGLQLEPGVETLIV